MQFLEDYKKPNLTLFDMVKVQCFIVNWMMIMKQPFFFS